MANPSPRATAKRASVALVLAGGAARGAYEVGVLWYVMEDVARAVRRPVRFDVLCGTSVGALNACGLAAWSHEGPLAIRRLIDVWCALDLDAVVRPDLPGLVAALRHRGREVPAREAGLLDSRGIAAVVREAIPFERIRENLQRGLFDALAVSTTHVRDGRTVVFVETKRGALPTWGRDPTTEARAVTISAEHALASAAIPILFPAVRVGSEFHADGGLRQNEPLSPARRLGADAVLVVNPRFTPTTPLAEKTEAKEEAFPGPLFLLGKTLNALLLDRIDTDLARMRAINAILAAGTRAYGPTFVGALNVALNHAPERGLRPMRPVLVRASEDIGELAAAFVREHAHALSGFAGRLVRRLAEGAGEGGAQEVDLLSYLLFDGGFARSLIDLGWRDARAQHDELCALFEPSAAA